MRAPSLDTLLRGNFFIRSFHLAMRTLLAGQRRTNSKQRSALGVDKANTPGSRVEASEFSRSEPLDQEVKTKLILELVTGSEMHRWVNAIQVESNESSGPTTTIRAHYGPSRFQVGFKSEAPEAFRISRKLCMGEMKDICD